MSDGTLIIDTRLDHDSLQDDLDTLQANVEQAAEGIAEEIAEAGEALGKTIGEKAVEGVTSAISEAAGDGTLEDSGQEMGEAVADGLSEEVDNDLGKDLGEDVQEGLESTLDKEAGKDAGAEVGEGLAEEVDSDLGEDLGGKVQEGLEDSLDKDTGEEIGEELGGGISDGMEQSTGSIGDVFKKIVSSEAFQTLAQFALAFIKNGIENAAELEKWQKRVETLFGDSAAQVSAFADNAKAAYGIGKINAREYAGDVGASLKKLGVSEKYIASMSTSIVGLSGDMASAFGADQTDTMDALQAAIEGNAGALDAFGISMSTASLEAYAVSQGLNQSYASMTDAEKAALRYAYIMDQTSGIQGHFAENSGDFANQLTTLELNISTLATNIGEKVLPVINWVLQGLNSIFEGPKNNGLPDAINGIKQDFDSFMATVDAAETAYADTVANIQTRKELAEGYLLTLETLENKESLTDADALAMQNAVAALTNLYPELKADIDAETGLFQSNTQALRDNIQALSDHALAKAAQVLSAQYDEALITATTNLVTATTAQKEAWLALDAAQKAHEGTQAALTELQANGYQSVSALNGAYLDGIPNITTYMTRLADGSYILNDWATSQDYASGLLNLFEARLINTGVELDSTNEKFETAQSVVEGYNSEIAAIGDEKENTNQTLREMGINLEAASDTATEKSEEMSEAADTAQSAADDTAAAAEDQSETSALQAQALTVEELSTAIQTATKSGVAAQEALAAAKAKVSEDAAAILTDMETLITTLGLDVDAMVETMNQIVTDGEVGAASAGRGFAKAAGDGYREYPYLKDAVTASLSEALTTLSLTNPMFVNAGRSIVSSIAQGVNENAGVLANAVRDAVQSAVAAAQSASVTSYGNRYGYPHRAGLEYVPYDEYPASLHKGEAVLTASEAALWRGGMNVREAAPASLKLDYEAMARAIWDFAPEGGDVMVSLNGEMVGRIVEPTVSAVQGRRVKG
ncbi:MAG: hypothetical protein VB099_21090 [Candidatus Limiplasma sp.]|nr:hypothetical protein [Candidatus Limiplasma sp.]